MSITRCERRRVALFHPCLIHGGIQRVFVNLAQGLLEHGLAVDLVQATPEGDFRCQVPADVRLVDLNASRALTSMAPLMRYLRRERPHVMISAAIQTNIAAIWARRLACVSTRLVLTEHNIVSVVTTGAPTFRARMMPVFIRRFYPWADDLVAVSQGAAKDLAAMLGGGAPRIHVIYNPIIGPEFWERAADTLSDARFLEDSRPTILAVGRLHYHKDYPTLLQAFEIVRRTADARLVFLGDGEEKVRLEALTRQLGVGAGVSFLGNVSNPLPYMKQAAVLALSSTVESLGNVLIEAMAVGLPIVATDCPTGPREILGNGMYGTLVPVGDSSALAEALLSVLRAESRPVIPKEAFIRFTVDYVINRYLAVLGLQNNCQTQDSDA